MKRICLMSLLLILLLPTSAGAASKPTEWRPPTDWNPAKFYPSLIQLAPLEGLKGRYAQKAPARVAPPALPVVDLSAWMEPVANQGGQQSCVGWAIGYGLAGWWANRQGKINTRDSLHPMALWAPLANYQNQGIWPKDAMARVASVGITPRSRYVPNVYDNQHRPTVIELAAGAPFRFTSWRQLFYQENGGGQDGANAIKAELAALRPVALTIRVYSDLLTAAPTFRGQTYTHSATATKRGLHEILALGYNRDGVLIQNSWGAGWGNWGQLRLSWATIQNDIVEADVADGMVP